MGEGVNFKRNIYNIYTRVIILDKIKFTNMEDLYNSELRLLGICF